MYKSSKIFFVLFSLFLLSTSSIFASQKIIKDFINSGDRSLRKDNSQEALLYFSRALLLDPTEEYAQERIIDIAGNFEFPSSLSIQLVTFEDLIKQISQAKNQILYLKKQRDLTSLPLKGRGLDDQILINIFRQVYSEMPEISEQEFSQAITNVSHPIEAVNLRLKFELDKMRQLSLIMEKQINALIAHQNQMNTHFLAKDIKKGDKITINLNEKVFTKKDEIDQLKEQVATLNQKVSTLNREIKSRDLDMKRMNSQIVDLTMASTEQEISLNEKTSQIYELNQNVIELESRVNLGKKLIEDKDVEVRKLRGILKDTKLTQTQLQQDFTQIVSQKDEKINEINGILEIYKGKLSSASKAVKVNSKNIDRLKDELLLTKSKVFERNIVIENTLKNLSDIENRLIALSKQLKEAASNKVVSSKKNSNLKTNISSLQQQLNDVHVYLSKKIKYYKEITQSEN